jgi:hypothetical protein
VTQGVKEQNQSKQQSKTVSVERKKDRYQIETKETKENR